MLTIIESPLFSQLWPDYWSEQEHDEFAVYLASIPEAGDLRKIAEELDHD